jgi:hypothetical protein
MGWAGAAGGLQKKMVMCCEMLCGVLNLILVENWDCYRRTSRRHWYWQES